MTADLIWARKVVRFSVGLLAIFTLGACPLRPPVHLSVRPAEPKPFRAVPPRAPPLVFPRIGFEPYEDPAPPMQTLGNSIAQALRAFEASHRLCASFTRQEEIDALEKFVERAWRPVLPLYSATFDAVSREHPGFAEFLGAAQKMYGEAHPLKEGLVWLASLELIDDFCRTREPIDAQTATSWSAILLQFGSSREAILQAAYAAFEHLPQEIPNSREQFFWATQQNSRSGFSTLFTLLLNVNERVGRTKSKDSVSHRALLVDATANLRAGLPHLSCNSEVSVTNVSGPALQKHGSFLFSDSIASFVVRCQNTSDTAWMISESLLAREPRDGCLYDLSDAKHGGGDVVLPELRPGQSTEITLGPMLISASCRDNIKLAYDLVSSHHNRTGQLEITIPIEDPELRLSTLELDEDIAGASIEDKRSGIGPDDRAELRLQMNGLENLEVEISHFKPLDLRIHNQFSVPVVFLPATGTERVSADDVDLKAVSQEIWNTSPQNVLASDAGNHWFLAKIEARNACSAFSRFMPQEFQTLYQKSCAHMTYPEFVALAERLQAVKCEGRTQISAQPQGRFQDGDGSHAAESATVATLPVPTTALTRIVHPTYAQVVGAVRRLIELKALPSAELDSALQHLDFLVGTPLYPSPSSFTKPEKVVRERARRLILAEIIANAQAKHLGSNKIDVLAILRNDSERTLQRFDLELMRLEMRGEVRNRFGHIDVPRTESVSVEPEKTLKKKGKKQKAGIKSKAVVIEAESSLSQESARTLEDLFVEVMTSAGCETSLKFPKDISDIHLVYRRMLPVSLEPRVSAP